MKRVYSADSVAMAWHIHNMLEYHGIATVLRNMNLFSVAGELPVSECLPEVWVSNDLDFRYAEQLVQEVNQPQSAELAGEPDWQCPSCHENNAATFDICWQCQMSRHQELTDQQSDT